ncbi:MAG TPA: hypothetical protein ENN66_07510 [Proteobacteria bacterium]|nr:hypothetical protein [Pseudomonadota bacterium]
MRLLTIYFAFMLSLLCPLAGLTPAAAESDAAGVVLANIDGDQITVADFDDYLKLFHQESAFAQCDHETRGRHLQNLINRRLLLEEAQKLGYFAAPELKSHGRLDQGEQEAFALRKLLTEKVVKPGTATREAIESYQAEHAVASYAVAETELNHRLRRQLFDDFVLQLRKIKRIETYENNLK